MTADSPSWTAEVMALFRALESARPPQSRLFEDPLARAFLGLPFRAVLLLARLPGGADVVSRIIERRWGGPFGAAVCRTRFIDDALTDALRAGVEQVVILGAGFDCRAYRLPGIERTRVFEVDHPATQAAKRARLVRLLGGLPEHVVFVPADLTRDPLAGTMAAAGLRSDARTFVLWEGVTNYLDPEAVDATLRWAAGAGSPGSLVLFTYMHRGMIDGSVSFEGAAEAHATVERAGEPYTFGFDPNELPGYLAARGLELLADVSAPEYRARYLRPLGREMKVWEFYRAALARVSAKSG